MTLKELLIITFQNHTATNWHNRHSNNEASGLNQTKIAFIPNAEVKVWILSIWCLVTISSVQFSSVTQSCPTLCDPMNCSTPGLLVHHQLQDLTQIHYRHK